MPSSLLKALLVANKLRVILRLDEHTRLKNRFSSAIQHDGLNGNN